MLLPLLPLQLTTHPPALTLCSENHRHRITNPFPTQGRRGTNSTHHLRLSRSAEHIVGDIACGIGFGMGMLHNRDVGDVYVGACAIVEHGVYTGEGIGIEG
ncbi:hypothetical protein BDQ17DRAFT_1337533, partial [Cyathus striatus]